MRITFFILLFANLVLLLWHTQIVPMRNKEPSLPQIPLDRKLVLVSEYKAAQHAKENAAQTPAAGQTSDEPLEKLPEIEIVDSQPTSTPAEVEPQPAPPASICYTLGPFKELSATKIARRRLEKIASVVEQRSKLEQEQYGYRVYLKSYATREEAVAESRKLADLGIRDYYIISDDPEHNNGISLGLFRKKSGAIRRMAQIRRFDFKPHMEIRYRDTTIYWLDYQQNADADSEALYRELSESDPGLQRLDRDC